MDTTQLAAAYQAHVAHLEHAYQSALARSGHDGVLVHSGSLVKRSAFDDQYWSLRLVPHFQHWAHVPWPDCALWVPARGKARLVVYEDRSYWERWPAPPWELLRGGLDVAHVDDPAKIAAQVPAGARAAFIGENTARAAEWGVRPEDACPAALMEALDELRVFKTRFEVLCLEEANRVAALGHQQVAAAFHAGERSEFRLHLRYLETTAQDDPETPYKNIVAVGQTASILHHVSYRRERLDGPVSLLVDAGATYLGYAADITRTHVAVGGAASELFADLVGRVERLQQQLCRAATVGRPFETLHDETHVLVGQVLRELGLVRMDVEDMVKTGVTRRFLPHGLGHSLGLQCHDVGCARVKPRAENRWLRNTRTIEPNQCFTIEPGVYFVDTLMDELQASPQGAHVSWKDVDALRPFGGVRIEDDLVIHPAGTPAENLTRAYLR